MPVSIRDQLQATLGAAYVVQRELEGGGMSRVFAARDETLGRDIVVKVLAPELAEGLSAERFTREIRVAAGLQHPHIVPLLAAGTMADGLPYYTMPFVEGESLRARLAAGPMSRETALSVLRDVLRALAYAHARGIVHRDVKPDNVLLCAGTAVVTDFGIAKAVQASRTQAPDGHGDSAASTLTQVGTALGTPAYIAPEQAAGDDVDQRADLYSWGVMAYELLAERHPFAGRSSAQQLIAAHIAEVPAPLTVTAGGITRPLATLVMRCLEKDRARRPTSAAEVLAVLDGTGAASSTALSRQARVGGLAALAAALLLAAGLAWRSERSRGARAESGGPTILAVLPFEHSGPAEQAVFADGLTDAVTAKLGALPGLAVIDRRSAAQYRATTKRAQQIGAELGVRYLLEGVVRWARDGAGTWRAQVTPTLVDVRTGTTRWTGTPTVVTPGDPFTAQATIATDVAVALEVALRPADQAALARRPTDDPEAFAAYQRGLGIEEASLRAPPSVYQRERALAEYERAVALDPGFAEAWVRLVRAHAAAAAMSPGDQVRQARLRTVLDRAGAHAREHPLVLLTLASVRRAFDAPADTAGYDALVRRALAAAPNDGLVLSSAAAWQRLQGRPDSAYALRRRAAMLDPRAASALSSAMEQATSLRRWGDARRYADALIALDSTDEQGWAARAWVDQFRGDTLGMQRELARALAHVPRPSGVLLTVMAYAGEPYGRRFVALSARELGIATLQDSVWNYYDTKADVFLRLGDVARARVYFDSVRALLTGRALTGPSEPFLLAVRASAEAALGDSAAARRSLARAVILARPRASRRDLTDVLEPGMLAAIHTWLGEPEAAVRYLEIIVADPDGGSTARGLATEPRFLSLHGTPAFERFLRAHPD